MIKFFAGSCLSELGIVLKEPSTILMLWMKPPVKTEAFIYSPDGFFNYEPLFTSSCSKNLIIPEAAMFSTI